MLDDDNWERHALIVLGIIFLVALLTSAVGNNKTEFSGKIDAACIQTPPDYDCDSPSPEVREQQQTVLMQGLKWNAEGEWTQGLGGDMELESFNSRASLRCTNEDCSEHEGQVSGTFQIFIGPDFMNARYQGQLRNGALTGTFSITGGSPSYRNARGRGSFVLTSGGGIIDGEFST